MDGERVQPAEKSSGVQLSSDLKPGAPQESGKPSGESKGFIRKVTGSGWFWASLGAVVLGALIISNNQVTNVPTHTMQ